MIAIIPTADRQKATVKVRVGFEKLDARILPQMGVKVAFQSNEPAEAAADGRGALVLPKTVMRSSAGRDIVWVVRDGRVERRAVTVSTSGDEVTVVAGLAAGEAVVVDPPGALADGLAVVIDPKP